MSPGIFCLYSCLTGTTNLPLRMVIIGSCRYFDIVDERMMLLSFSLTRSFAILLLRRILASAGEAPSKSSSSLKTHLVISSSRYLCEMSPEAIFASPMGVLSSSGLVAEASDSRQTLMAFRHLPILRSSSQFRNKAAFMRFRQERMSGKSSTGEYPVRRKQLSASAVSSSSEFTSSSSVMGLSSSASSRLTQQPQWSLSLSSILSYSRVL